jgi:coronin-7
MEGEANRVLQLTANAVVPISYIVPRKVYTNTDKPLTLEASHRTRNTLELFLQLYAQSYREFHADLFPETAGSEAPIYASQWMTGTNATVEKILLDPSRWQGKNLHVTK